MFPGVSTTFSFASTLDGLLTCLKSLYIMSCWYTRKELALRTSILYSGLLVAQCISGLLAAGIFAGMDRVAGLAGWQWLFIIEALMSTVCGIAAFFTLPDYPHSKTGSQRWSMDEDMRRLGEARIVADRVTGSVGSGGVFAGLKLALKDFKTYVFVSPLSFPFPSVAIIY